MSRVAINISSYNVCRAAGKQSGQTRYIDRMGLTNSVGRCSAQRIRESTLCSTLNTKDGFMTKRKAKAKKLPKGMTKKQHDQWKRIHREIHAFLVQLDESLDEQIQDLSDDLAEPGEYFECDYGMITIAGIALQRFIDSMSHINRD